MDKTLVIAADQPVCFPESVLVRCSSKSDGSLLARDTGPHTPEFIERRRRFCAKNGVAYDGTVYQQIVYAPDRTYDTIAVVDATVVTARSSEVVADALFTTSRNIALLLPVADCIATVLYDTKRQILALAHLGRHSTYSKLAEKLVVYFKSQGSSPKDLIVWMGPHAQKMSYRLEWFDKGHEPEWQGYFEERADGVYLDMAGYNRQLFERAGVPLAAIHTSPVDTVRSEQYFSHSRGDHGGRMAVLAMIR